MTKSTFGCFALTATLATSACNGTPPGSDEGGSSDGGIVAQDDSSSDGGDTDAAGDEGEGADGSGGSDDGGLGTLDCGGVIVVEDARPRPAVMLVLDKSGSMAEFTWDDDADASTPEVTRWHSLHGIVTDLLDARASAMRFGLALFPAIEADHHDQTACAVADDAEVAPAPFSDARVRALLPGADAQVGGGTPARGGVLNAIEALSGLASDRPRAMVLVTDGAANCVPGVEPFYGEYDDELELAVGSAHAELGIPTYVVGVDIGAAPEPNTGRDVRADLDRVAQAGGAASNGAHAYYETADGLSLRAALDEIAARVSCTVTLAGMPAPEAVRVRIDGAQVERVGQCDGANGWRAAGPDSIELCGAACDAFVQAGTLTADYACLPVG